MLAKIEAGSDKLRITDAQNLVVPFVLGDEFRLVEERKQVTTRFKVGAEIDEAAFLVETLAGIDKGIAET